MIGAGILLGAAVLAGATAAIASAGIGSMLTTLPLRRRGGRAKGENPS